MTLLVLTSCTDLSQVTKFGDSSQKVGASFADIAAEASKSCERANRFVTTANPVKRLDCSVYPKLNPPLLAINSALFGYIGSLGKLASTDTSKVASGLDNLSNDLKKGDPDISAASTSKASAAGGLAKAITEIWAGGYRQRRLASIISGNNQAVADVTDFLSDYAADKYRQAIADEVRYESSYCDIMRSPKIEPLATMLLEKSCSSDDVQLNQKLQAIKAYQIALATIRNTHDQLATKKNDWDLKELSKELSPGISDLEKSAAAIKKAF